jgi:ribosome-binding factor A
MSIRKEKIQKQIGRVISELLLREVKDPRIGFTTITGVELSNDYSVARVGVSVMGSPRELRRTLEGLNSAKGFIQHKIGKSIKMRVTPKIHFFLDSSVANGVEMVSLLEKLEHEGEESRDDENDGNGNQGG